MFQQNGKINGRIIHPDKVLMNLMCKHKVVSGLQEISPKKTSPASSVLQQKLLTSQNRKGLHHHNDCQRTHMYGIYLLQCHIHPNFISTYGRF